MRIFILSLSCFTLASAAHTAEGTWKASNFGQTGDWLDTSRWENGIVPNATSDKACFPPETSGALKTATVVIPIAGVTIGELQCKEDNIDEFCFTAAGPGSKIIFNNGVANAIFYAEDISDHPHFRNILEAPATFKVKLDFQSTVDVTGGGYLVWNGGQCGPGGMNFNFPKEAKVGQLEINSISTYQGPTCIQSGRVVTSVAGAIPFNNNLTLKRCGSLEHRSEDILENTAYNLSFDDTGNGDLGELKITDIVATVFCLEGNGKVSYSDTNSSVFQVCTPKGQTCTFSGILNACSPNVGNESNADISNGNRFVKLGEGIQILTSTDSKNKQFKPRFFVQQGVLWGQNPCTLGLAPTDPCDKAEFAHNVFVNTGGTLKIGEDGQSHTYRKIIRLNGTGYKNQGALNVVGNTTTLEGAIHVGWEHKGLPQKASSEIQVEENSIFCLNGVLIGENKKCHLTKDGLGTMILKGNKKNEHIGELRVRQGTLKLLKTGGAQATCGNVRIQASGCLQLGGNNQIPDTSILIIEGADAKYDPTCGGMGNYCDSIRRLNFWQGEIIEPTNGKVYLTLCDSNLAIDMRNVTIPGKVEVKECGDIRYRNSNKPLQQYMGMSAGGIIHDVNFSGGPGNHQPRFIVEDSSGKFDLVVENSIGKTFCKTGDGKLLMAGTHSHTIGDNPNKVSAGHLCIGNGATFEGEIVVENGGSLCGEGTINTPCVTVRDGGSIEPGNCTTGTLCINGPVKFEGGSTLCVEVKNSAMITEHDLLQVKGNPVTIAPTAKVTVKVDSNSVNPTDPSFCVTLLQVDQGQTLDTFLDECVIAPPMFSATMIEQNGNTLQLKLSMQTPILLTPGPNPPEIIDHLFEVAGACLQVQRLLMAIEGYEMNELIAALEELDPSMIKGQHISDQNSAIRQRSVITNRLTQLHRLSCGCNMSDFRYINAWVDGNWGSYDQKAIGMERGFQTHTGYLQAGWDTLFEENLIFGLAAGLAFSDIDWRRASSSGGMQGATMTLYASKFWDAFWISAAVQGGSTHNEYKRHINIPTLPFIADGAYYIHHALTHLDMGYTWNISERIDLRPFARVDYIYQKQDGFCEKDLDCLALEIRHVSMHMLRSETGIELSYCLPLRNEHIKAIVDGKVSYVREDRFNGKKIHARSAGTFGGFSALGINPDHNLVSPAIGLSFMSPTCDRFHMRIGYEGEFGSGHTMHHGSAKIGYIF